MRFMISTGVGHPQRFELMVFFERCGAEAGLLQIGELGCRRFDDVVVKAGDLHFARLGIEAIRHELAYLRHGVAGGAARRPRMLISLARLEREAEALEAAKPGRASRARARHPDRIGYDDRVRLEQLFVPLDGRLEIGASDLLFRLPEKVHIDRRLVSEGVFGAPECGERGAFVVRRPASQVAILFLDESKRLGVPAVRHLRGLDVEVVVDGDGRVVGALLETPV